MTSPLDLATIEEFSLSLKQSQDFAETQSCLSRFLTVVGIDQFSVTLIKFYRESVYVTALFERLSNHELTIDEHYACTTKSSLGLESQRSEVPFFWDLSIFQDNVPEDVTLKAYFQKEGVDGGFSVPVVHSYSTMTTVLMAFHETARYRRQEFFLHTIALQLTNTLMRHRFPMREGRVFGSIKKASPPLSPREAEIISWVALGKSSWETSKILGISEHTINDHIENAVRKLCAKNRTEAVAIALLTHQVDLTKEDVFA